MSPSTAHPTTVRRAPARTAAAPIDPWRVAAWSIAVAICVAFWVAVALLVAALL